MTYFGSRLAWIVVGGFLLGAVPVRHIHAQTAFMTGNTLWEACDTTRPVIDVQFCMGYIVGVSDIVLSSDGFGRWRACIPHGATKGQVTDVVRAFLGKHPEQRHYGAMRTVLIALSEAFPCPRP